MKPPKFEYHDPRSVDEAFALLAEHGDEGKALAGGQSLVPLLNFRLAHPELAGAINAGEEVVVIGGEAVKPRLHLLMHQVVADRLLHGEPPEDWLAFDAMIERGVDAHEAQHAMAVAVR